MGGCPTADALSDLAAGRLSHEGAAELHHHLRGCESCGLALAAMAESAAPDAPDDPPELNAGVRVGRFELVELLGEGSMGAVWSARDVNLGRTVALKTLRPLADTADGAGMRRLMREAQAMARLSHPNVVTVHEVVESGENVCLAMELVGGGTLRAWLLERPRSIAEIVAVFTEAGKGLAAAHAAGLVHRDFKPENVLVGDDGRVRVTDFGLARPSGEVRPAAGSPDPQPLHLTRTGALVGTPAYMAPEQMRGEPIDARADVFGFCTALYEAVYGARPFAGETLDDLQRRAEANEVRPPPRGHAAPARLRQLLLRGLRASPAERWQSMDALLAALAEAGPRRKWPKAAAAATLLIAAGAAGLLLLRHGARVPQPHGSKVWPTDTIAVCWENPSAAGAEQRGWVRTAAATWSAASWVRFTGWEACAAGQAGIHIRIAYEQPRVLRLGRELDGVGGGMVLNFGYKNWDARCNDRLEACVKQVAVHEFAHALGFSHQPPTAGTGPQCDDAPVAPENETVAGPADPFSIMRSCAPDLDLAGPLAGDLLRVRQFYGSPAYARYRKSAAVWPTGKLYFFNGPLYSRFDLESDLPDWNYPGDIAGYWNGWPTAWAGGVDAVLIGNDGKAFFFRGSESLRYDVATDRVAGQPRPIADEFGRGTWPPAWTEIGAAVNWTGGKAFFFRGAEFLRYDLASGTVDAPPRAIAEGWPGLFPDGIDYGFLHPDGAAYFFRGSQYQRYDLSAGKASPAASIISRWPGVTF